MANKFPFVFDKPFASEGDFVLPKFEADPKVANWPQGFSGRFSEPPEDGGLFIEREAMNGIHNALSQNQAWQQSGQLPTFDPAYVAKSGGYPRGAVLWNIPNEWELIQNSNVEASATSWCGKEYRYSYASQVRRLPIAVVSVKDNNTDNFIENQLYIDSSWMILDQNVALETVEVPRASAALGSSISTYRKHKTIVARFDSIQNTEASADASYGYLVTWGANNHQSVSSQVLSTVFSAFSEGLILINGDFLPVFSFGKLNIHSFTVNARYFGLSKKNPMIILPARLYTSWYSQEQFYPSFIKADGNPGSVCYLDSVVLTADWGQ